MIVDKEALARWFLSRWGDGTLQWDEAKGHERRAAYEEAAALIARQLEWLRVPDEDEIAAATNRFLEWDRGGFEHECGLKALKIEPERRKLWADHIAVRIHALLTEAT